MKKIRFLGRYHKYRGKQEEDKKITVLGAIFITRIPLCCLSHADCTVLVSRRFTSSR